MLRYLNGAARIGNRLLRAVAIALALLLLAFSGYSILNSYYLEHTAFSGWNLVQYRPVDESGSISSASFKELKAINPDVVGWITIYDTNIDYPILQGPDNLYYVNRDLYGESTLTGSIYLQSENKPDFSDSFNLLYGHHFDNGAMFGDVSKFKDPEFLRSHRKGELITEDGIYYLNIFACIETDAYDPSIYGVTEVTDDSPEIHMHTPHKMVYYPPDDDNSMEDDMVDRTVGGAQASLRTPRHDNVLALSTCDDAETDGRDVVVADVEDGSVSRVPSTASSKSATVPKTGEILSERWAFLNLLSLLFTLLCIVPFIIRFLSGRKEQIRTGYIIGALINLIAVVIAAIIFVHTENIYCEVTLRDRWTPLMIFIFAAALMVTSLTDRGKYKREYSDD